MIIEDGAGNSYKVKVTSSNKMNVSGRVAPRISYASRDHGYAWSTVAEDANPTAGEYKIWMQNDLETAMVIHRITTFAVGAATSWKLWRVTGTGATASAIVPVSLNTAILSAAGMTIKGGAGDVTGLTVASVAPLIFWGNGPAYSTVHVPLEDALRLGTNQAIAIEVEASTDALVAVSILCYHEVDGA